MEADGRAKLGIRKEAAPLSLGVFSACLSYIQLLQTLFPTWFPVFYLHSSASAKACAEFCLLIATVSLHLPRVLLGSVPGSVLRLKTCTTMPGRLKQFSLSLQDFFSLFGFWFFALLSWTSEALLYFSLGDKVYFFSDFGSLLDSNAASKLPHCPQVPSILIKKSHAALPLSLYFGHRISFCSRS